jgi:hypothetical protein
MPMNGKQAAIYDPPQRDMATPVDVLKLSPRHAERTRPNDTALLTGAREQLS